MDFENMNISEIAAQLLTSELEDEFLKAGVGVSTEDLAVTRDELASFVESFGQPTSRVGRVHVWEPTRRGGNPLARVGKKSAYVVDLGPIRAAFVL